MKQALGWPTLAIFLSISNAWSEAPAPLDPLRDRCRKRLGELLGHEDAATRPGNRSRRLSELLMGESAAPKPAAEPPVLIKPKTPYEVIPDIRAPSPQLKAAWETLHKELHLDALKKDPQLPVPMGRAIRWLQNSSLPAAERRWLFENFAASLKQIYKEGWDIIPFTNVDGARIYQGYLGETLVFMPDGRIVNFRNPVFSDTLDKPVRPGSVVDMSEHILRGTSGHVRGLRTVVVTNDETGVHFEEFLRHNRGLEEMRSEELYPAAWLDTQQMREARLLDVATGGGQFVSDLRAQGVKAVGIDIALDTAQGNEHGQFLQADAARMPYAKNTFTHVYHTQGVLSREAPEPRLLKYVQESVRVLAVGGKLRGSPVTAQALRLLKQHPDLKITYEKPSANDPKLFVVEAEKLR